MRERNIAVSIILSIVTCGIYMIYWMICIADETNAAAETPDRSGGMVFLLSLITCSIYMYYWAYRQGEKMDAAKTKRGLPASNSGVVYLLLSIFGLSIVSLVLMQSELNKMAN
ncbi:MAG: DUF4234 domain-containing protein [Lachnospiraceae bacterium]